MDKITTIKSKETEELVYKIQSTADELKNSEVTLESYKKFHQKVSGLLDFGVNQLQQYETQYRESRQPYLDWLDTDAARDDLQKKTVIPYDSFYSLYESLKKAQSMLSLFTYLIYLNDIYRSKVEPLLDEVNQLQVRSDTLKELKEESKTNRDWVKEMLTTKMESMQSATHTQIQALRTELQSNINQRFGELVDVFRIALSDSKQLKEFDKTLQETKKSFDVKPLAPPPPPVKKELEEPELPKPNQPNLEVDETDEEERITPKDSGKPPRPSFSDQFPL